MSDAVQLSNASTLLDMLVCGSVTDDVMNDMEL